jgi:hypothetical protein
VALPYPATASPLSKVNLKNKISAPTNKELNLEFSNCLTAKKNKQQLQTGNSRNLKD